MILTICLLVVLVIYLVVTIWHYEQLRKHHLTEIDKYKEWLNQAYQRIEYLEVEISAITSEKEIQ